MAGTELIIWARFFCDIFWMSMIIQEVKASYIKALNSNLKQQTTPTGNASLLKSWTVRTK
jgi:hypothetical protein